MVENMNNCIDEKLNKFMGREVIINQEGFLENKYEIQKLKYGVEYEVLSITDEKSDNYLRINLNQIYKIEDNEKEIKLFLDNDIRILMIAKLR